MLTTFQAVTGLGAFTGGSDPIDLVGSSLAAIQLVITGTLVGSLKLRSSCDSLPISNWDDTLDSTAAVNGPGVVTWNISQIGYTQMQVYFTYTSGSGTITGRFTGKRFK